MLRYLAENWQIKLMSFGFALVLWFFVMGERSTEIGYAVPLELHNLPPGTVLVNEVPKTVDVSLSGPRALLANLDYREVGIRIDLTGLSPGLTTFRRLDELLRLPVGIRATRVTPATIEVKLDRLIEKEVPLRARLTGRPASGFRLESVEISPATVTLLGGEGEIGRLEEVMTEPVDLTGLQGSKEVVVAADFSGRSSKVKERQKIVVYLKIVPGTVPGKRKQDRGAVRE